MIIELLSMLCIFRILLFFGLFCLLIIVARNISEFTNMLFSSKLFRALPVSFSNKFISFVYTFTYSVNTFVICKVCQICLLYKQKKVILKILYRFLPGKNACGTPNNKNLNKHYMFFI